VSLASAAPLRLALIDAALVLVLDGCCGRSPPRATHPPIDGQIACWPAGWRTGQIESR